MRGWQQWCGTGAQPWPFPSQSRAPTMAGRVLCTLPAWALAPAKPPWQLFHNLPRFPSGLRPTLSYTGVVWGRGRAGVEGKRHLCGQGWWGGEALDPLFANMSTQHSIKYMSQSLSHAHSPLPLQSPARAVLLWSHHVLSQPNPTLLLAPSTPPSESHTGSRGSRCWAKSSGCCLLRDKDWLRTEVLTYLGGSARSPLLPRCSLALRDQPQTHSRGGMCKESSHPLPNPAPVPSRQEATKPQSRLSLPMGLCRKGNPRSARAACPCGVTAAGPQPRGPIYC